jgi:hypothetical protein
MDIILVGLLCVLGVLLGFVVIAILMHRHTTKLDALKQRIDTLEMDFSGHIDTQKKVMKNLIDSINYNDTVANIKNHNIQHYMSNIANDSNEKMIALDSKMHAIKDTTNSNFHIMDDNIKNNVSDLYSKTTNLDNKHQTMENNTSNRFDAIENNKLNQKDFNEFQMGEFEDHRKLLAEHVQTVGIMASNQKNYCNRPESSNHPQLPPRNNPNIFRRLDRNRAIETATA